MYERERVRVKRRGALAGLDARMTWDTHNRRHRARSGRYRLCRSKLQRVFALTADSNRDSVGITKEDKKEKQEGRKEGGGRLTGKRAMDV